MFGSGPPRVVPYASLGLFGARDAGTVFSSFLLPPRAAEALERAGVDKERAKNVAQIACPVAFQAVSAPVHLLGLDIYNRSAEEVKREGRSRISASFKDYGAVVGARMMRVLPAFGVGGIGNRVLKGELIRVIKDVYK